MCQPVYGRLHNDNIYVRKELIRFLDYMPWLSVIHHLLMAAKKGLLNYYKTEKKISFLELILGETKIFLKNHYFSAF